jgi:hypothetical protein
MKTSELDSPIAAITESRLDRRNFFRKAGYFGFGAAVSGLALGNTPAHALASAGAARDTTDEIFTAFLIAEDLATTFYYNGLTGAVIQDPALAGPGGSALHPQSSGDAGNVAYLRSAYTQENTHATLFRNLLTGDGSDTGADPQQTFYFPVGTFDTLANFLPILDALENAFIGAYLLAVQEFAYKATLATTGGLKGTDTRYSASQYELMSKRMASIMGVECEHRVIGRDIGGESPINNLTYESVDGLTSIFNGSASAVMALTPFLTPSTGPGYPLATALRNIRVFGGPSSGGLINF